MDFDGDGFGSALAFEVAPAVLLGTAVGFAVDAVAGQAAQLLATALSGAAAFLLAWHCLRRVGSSAAFRLPQFEHVALEAAEVALPDGDELPPVEDAASQPAAHTNPPVADELLLDDMLADLGSESRVVRLFQPDATPTPGELQARIAHHLRAAPQRFASPDATEALHDAIAELRRSLR